MHLNGPFKLKPADCAMIKNIISMIYSNIIIAVETPELQQIVTSHIKNTHYKTQTIKIKQERDRPNLQRELKLIYYIMESYQVHDEIEF